jgi:hypothetical protein
VGDVLRRTFERAVWRASRTAIVTALLLQQLEVGVRSGCQKQIWIARVLHDMITRAVERRESEDAEADPALLDMADWIYIKLDQKNAHNSYKRARAQAELNRIEGA